MTDQHSPEAIAAYDGYPLTKSMREIPSPADAWMSGYDAGRTSVTEQRPVSTRERIVEAIFNAWEPIAQHAVAGEIDNMLADAVLTVVQDEREVRADQRERDAQAAESGQFDGDDPRSSDEAAYNTARREAAAAIREGKQL